MTDETMSQLAINTIRTLSIDAVQQAKSGHPGTPMALASLVYTLWNRGMRLYPRDPIWPNRDRFVLSNGHASLLLWCVLILSWVEPLSADSVRLRQPWGHLGLDNLCWIYDNNHITIEGSTRLAFTEDVGARFASYGWDVQRVDDANDLDRLARALDVFRQRRGRPTIIILDSHIGYGSPHK